MDKNTNLNNYLTDYVAYTDGSCNNLSPYGEGGAAYIILDHNKNIICLLYTSDAADDA